MRLNEAMTRKSTPLAGQITSIFFIQASSAAAFAVFFSGLSLYLTQQAHYTKENAAAVTGLFLSLNYFLQLIGGIIANRTITYKRFYGVGSAISAIGCLLLANGINLNVGLSLCLMSSLVTNVCLNMFITSLFTQDQIAERRIAFIWNYIGMNLGFLIGTFLTGYYTIQNNYIHLYGIMSILTSISLTLTLIFIKFENQRDIKKPAILQYGITIAIMLSLSAIIFVLLSHASIAQKYMTITLLIILAYLISHVFKKDASTKKHIIPYALYSIMSITFWAIYMLTPTAFMQFIENDVQNKILNFTIAPQWIVNIDSIVILILAPCLAVLLKKNKNNNQKPLHTTSYFTLAFTFVTFAFFILLLGLSLVVDQGKLPIWVVLGYLILLTTGEIFISPIGNSLIGELIPDSLRGLMTGAWSINIGVGSLFASIIANKLILPAVDKHGLIVSNLVQLKNIVSFIFIMLALIVSILWVISTKIHRIQKLDSLQPNQN